MKSLLAVVGLLAVASANSPALAAVITYKFSGPVFPSYWNIPSPGVKPSSFTGSVTWDTATPDSDYLVPDRGRYSYASPYGPVGMSLTTNTGLTFATDSSNTNAQSSFHVVADVQGSTFSQDTISFVAQRTTLPAGWTGIGAINFSLTGTPDGAMLQGSDAIPQSLPGYDPDIVEFPHPLYTNSLSLNLFNYTFPGGSGSSANIVLPVSSLRHAGTSDSITLPGDAVVNQSLGGGSQSAGGLDAQLAVQTGGAFSYTYSSIAASQLPNTAPFLPGTFTLGVPGTALQIWDLSYGGTLNGPTTLSFGFDPSILGEWDVGIWHFGSSNTWEYLGGTISGNTITFETDSFSPFVLALSPDSAAVPEPSSLALLGFGAVTMFVGAVRRRRQVSGEPGA
jgi:hypothetical protein